MKKSETRPRRGIDRRTMLKGAVGVAAVGTGITGFPAYLKAAGKPIKIGMPTIMSGRVALLGESALAGAKIRLNRINKSGARTRAVQGKSVSLRVDPRGPRPTQHHTHPPTPPTPHP